MQKFFYDYSTISTKTSQDHLWLEDDLKVLICVDSKLSMTESFYIVEFISSVCKIER